MLELGPDEAAMHRELGRELAASGLHLLFTVGKLSAETAEAAREGALGDVRSFRTASEAAAALVEEVRPGDMILVKGSRAIGLDRVVRELQEKLGAPGAAGEGEA
jgi:UDP-N-acetylmuramoyl-tripeptide--D-alanyl-D-alanine ligase